MAENIYTYGDMLIAAGAIFIVLALILFLVYKFLYSNLNKRTEKILEQDNGELNSEILDLVVSLKKHEDPPQYVKHINKKLSNVFDSCKITDRKTVSDSESSYGLIALTAEDHMFTYLTNLGPLIENEVQKFVNGEEMATCAENISAYKASVEKSKAIKNKLIERLLQVPEQYSTVMKVTSTIIESLRTTHSEDEEIIKILDNICECAKSKGESCGGILTSQNNKNDMIDVINKIQEYDSIYNKDRNGNMSLVCYAAYKNLFAYLEVFFGGLHGIYKK